MTTYALNGLGRIGKLALKPLLARGAQVAWINDAVGDAANACPSAGIRHGARALGRGVFAG